MPGGFQGLLMQAIGGTPIPDIIRARLSAGVTIGGAGAGAAAMSRTMIADETTPDGGDIDGPATNEGLGLWPDAIVSPHFAERRRLNPLIAIVQDHATLFGVGIDEGTAVVVSRGEFEVLGRGTVVILDAHRPRGLPGGLPCEATLWLRMPHLGDDAPEKPLERLLIPAHPHVVHQVDQPRLR